MAITTAGDIIALILKTAGVVGSGQTPLAEDSNDTLNILNMMLGQWSQRRWLVYHLKDSYLQSTGALTYSIGAGGDFNIARPSKLDSVFTRLNPGANGAPDAQSVDYPCEIIEARETYNRIAAKGIPSFPQYAFYDSGFPLGTLYLWPSATTALEIHIATKDVLSGFTNLKTAINLPPEYFEAVYYNGVERVLAAYRLPADPKIDGLAAAALQTIRTANVQVPRMKMPPPIVGRGRYNIFSDQ